MSPSTSASNDLCPVLINSLPPRVAKQICDLAINAHCLNDGPLRLSVSSQTEKHRAETPPASGAAPFLELSTELRRQIFAASLPARTQTFLPLCNDIDRSFLKGIPNRPNRLPRRNRISDLMTLNKTICAEITEILYEERTFVIHVHEGLRHGGVEFLDAGRQPLQYQDTIEDARFGKFGRDDTFGFNRLQKIRIVIFPPAAAVTREAGHESARHTPINTYFMTLALCRLLQRNVVDGNREGEGGDTRNRIKSLEISFATPRTPIFLRSRPEESPPETTPTETYWWDPLTSAPRASSIHDLPNVHLLLRPFASLTAIHSVSIFLPPPMADHEPTRVFVAALERSMMSSHGSPVVWGDDDLLEAKIEGAREAMEEYVLYTLHGRWGYQAVAKMSEREVLDEGVGVEGGRCEDEAGIGEGRGESHGDEEEEEGDEWHGALTGTKRNADRCAGMEAFETAAEAAKGPCGGGFQCGGGEGRPGRRPHSRGCREATVRAIARASDEMREREGRRDLAGVYARAPRRQLLLGSVEVDIDASASGGDQASRDSDDGDGEPSSTTQRVERSAQTKTRANAKAKERSKKRKANS